MKIKFLIMLMVLFLSSVVVEGGNDNVGNGNVREAGEAQIWYLYHCGYAIKTKNHFLVFDYWEPDKNVVGMGLINGVINPEEIKDFKVRVFVTHSHSDHWDKRINLWQNKIKDIKYFFGWKASDNKEFHYLPHPRSSYKDEDMEVYTVNSQHSGVPEAAFLVKVDGVSVFHGGDYQGKMAKGAPSNALDDMKYLLARGLGNKSRLDIMMLGAWVGGSNSTIIRKHNPKVLFPMHNGGRENRHQKFVEDCKRNGLMNPVYCPWARGDSFVYKNGRIVKN